jgi:septal ring factor EnvC (AmiA/AmiB activator)
MSTEVEQIANRVMDWADRCDAGLVELIKEERKDNYKSHDILFEYIQDGLKQQLELTKDVLAIINRQADTIATATTTVRDLQNRIEKLEKTTV